MGTFLGHALPGTFFISFSVWWTINQFHRHYLCWKRNQKFTSTPTYSYSCGRLKLPLFEPALKISLVIMGSIGEFYTGYSFDEGKFIWPGNIQHMAMYIALGMSGLLDIMTYYHTLMPKDIDYVVWLFVFGIEGLQFTFHLHGRSEVDKQLHILLVFTILLNLMGVVLEMRFRHNVLAALSRSYFSFIQGTWFYQIGFILYNPFSTSVKWQQDDPVNTTMVTIYFAWHCEAVFLILLGIGCSLACYHLYSKRSFLNRKSSVEAKRLIQQDVTDDDSEIEISHGNDNTI